MDEPSTHATIACDPDHRSRALFIPTPVIWNDGMNMLLLIDNYDSFTYNLVQYLGELGADVHVYRNDAITLEQIEALRPEKIVISPGPCTPTEAGISVSLIQRFAGEIPIL